MTFRFGTERFGVYKVLIILLTYLFIIYYSKYKGCKAKNAMNITAWLCNVVLVWYAIWMFVVEIYTHYLVNMHCSKHTTLQYHIISNKHAVVVSSAYQYFINLLSVIKYFCQRNKWHDRRFIRIMRRKLRNLLRHLYIPLGAKHNYLRETRKINVTYVRKQLNWICKYV